MSLILQPKFNKDDVRPGAGVGGARGRSKGRGGAMGAKRTDKYSDMRVTRSSSADVNKNVPRYGSR